MSDLFRRKTIDQITEDILATAFKEGRAGLCRELNVVDLAALGIAAIVGAGIFSMIGNAAFHGGPAVVFLFVFTAVACGFSALCYAEFASRVPIAGSAYTYAYASFGELVAWIIGWDLLMEYAIGNIAVAISWSDYFTGLLDGYGLHVPEYLTMDYLSAVRGASAVSDLLAKGRTLAEIQGSSDFSGMYAAYVAWNQAPHIGDLRIICDLPALFITAIITSLVYVGIRESKVASNIMVALKLAVVLLVIVLGAFYVNPKNWSPFAPHGMGGVLQGVSGVFFAYIGFDAITTTAEECVDPQRDLPRGMIAALIICTILYILISLVLTGMVPSSRLAVGDPLAFVFGPQGANLPWVSGIIALSAIIAMATVLLVFQIGQPRIWMAMSRDGLLPPIFSSLHPRFRTPWFSTIVTGLVVAIPSLFLNLTEVTDLTSIGTLFAFTLVSGGILILNPRGENRSGRFMVPYINGQYIVPILFILSLAVISWFAPEDFRNYFSADTPLKQKIPIAFFYVAFIVLAIESFRKKLSLIPTLGVISCGYLISELGWTNWARFSIWLVVGLVLFFLYGRKHSKLNRSGAR